jgi:hypothetical protein
MNSLRLITQTLLIVTIAGCDQKNGTESLNFGHEVGNGGDVIECQQPAVLLGNKSIGLLDFYEARQRGMSLNFELGGDENARVVALIERIKGIDPDRAALYLSYASSFWSEAALLPNAHLPDIPDDGPVSLPGPNCEVKQIAIQSAPELPGEKRYNIDKALWDKLDVDERAGLILHEIAYREALDHAHETSKKIRYFNGLIVSDTIKTYAHSDYVDLLEKTLTLPALRTESGITMKMRNMELAEDGRVVSGESTQSPLVWNGVTYEISDPVITFANEPATVSFTLSGNIASSHLPNRCGDSKINSGSARASFDRSGTLIKLDSMGGSSNYPWVHVSPCSTSGVQTAYLTVALPRILTFIQGNIPEQSVSLGSISANMGPSDWANLADGTRIDLYDKETYVFDASGYISLSKTLYDPNLPRPEVMTNSLDGDGSFVDLTINDPAQAAQLFSAMAGYTARTDTDGETRYVGSPFGSFRFACKRWSDGLSSCQIILKPGEGSTLKFSDNTWEWRAGAERYESSSDRVDLINDISKLERPDECRTLSPGHGLTAGGLSICESRYPPFYADLIVRIQNIYE